jgi:GAF domain-containing protein
MQVLAEEASRMIGCERVAVYAVDTGRDRLEPLAAHDGGALNEAATAIFYTQALPLGLFPEPIPDQGGSHDWGTQYVDDVRLNLEIPEGEAVFLSGPGWVFGLRSRDQHRLGLLCLLDARHPPLTPDTTAFAQALAAQAAVALENAQLSQQSQSLLERAQALQAATNQIAAEHDTDRVLEGVMESARGVLDADGYTLWGCDLDSGWTQRASHGLGIPAILRNSRS